MFIHSACAQPEELTPEESVMDAVFALERRLEPLMLHFWSHRLPEG